MNKGPKKSSTPYVIPDHLNLDLPYDAEFKSEPIIFTVAEMIHICEPMLPYWNKKKLENPEPEIKWEEFSL